MSGWVSDGCFFSDKGYLRVRDYIGIRSKYNGKEVKIYREEFTEGVNKKKLGGVEKNGEVG